MKNIALLAVLLSGFAGLAFAFSGSQVAPGLSPSGVHTNLATDEQGHAVNGSLPSFKSPLTYLPNASGIYLATANLRNIPGRNDLIVPGYPLTQTINILLSNGDGTFATGTAIPTTYPPDGGATGPEEVATADVNGDGCLDIVVALHSASEVGVYLGTPGSGGLCTGAFTQAPWSPYAAASGIQSIGVAKLGLVSGATNFSIVAGQGSSTTIDVWAGNGDGTFGTVDGGPTATYTGGNGMRQMVLTDINNDGFVDIVTLDRTTRALATLFGTTGATFGSVVETSFPTISGGSEIGLAVGDLNGDAVDDVVIARSTGFLVYLGATNGANNWTPGLSGTYPAPTTPAGGGTFTTVAMGDINGDGIPDVALTLNGSGAPNSITAGVGIYYGSGGGSFGQVPFLASMAGQSGQNLGPQGIVLSDFNQDGFLDVAACSAVASTPSIPAVAVYNSQPSLRTVPAPIGVQNVYQVVPNAQESLNVVCCGTSDGGATATALPTTPLIGRSSALIVNQGSAAICIGPNSGVLPPAYQGDAGCVNGLPVQAGQALTEGVGFNLQDYCSSAAPQTLATGCTTIREVR